MESISTGDDEDCRLRICSCEDVDESVVLDESAMFCWRPNEPLLRSTILTAPDTPLLFLLAVGNDTSRSTKHKLSLMPSLSTISLMEQSLSSERRNVYLEGAQLHAVATAGIDSRRGSRCSIAVCDLLDLIDGMVSDICECESSCIGQSRQIDGQRIDLMADKGGLLLDFR